MKIIKNIFLYWILCCLFMSFTLAAFAWHKLENGSKELVKKYNFPTWNVWQEISRKEFLETLYLWYKDYKKQKGITIDYSRYKKTDNAKYFLDVDLSSDFWKKLDYFASVGAFSKRKYFDSKWKLSQKDFFIVMRRLRIMFHLSNCKALRICEKEVDAKTIFSKGVYYKYVSKILDRKLRKYGKTPKFYIDAGYKPYLSPYYNFPIRWQTLNGCYAFSIRNILKYKHGIGIHISKAEKILKKPWEKLWTPYLMRKFNSLVHVKKSSFFYIDTLISSLQAWEPVAISYYLDYYSYKEKKMKKVAHIVAAYSFDEKWIWVSETVSNKRKRVLWEDVFNKNWKVSNFRMFKYYYTPMEKWSIKEKQNEKKNNILVGEF